MAPYTTGVISFILREENGIQFMPCSFRIISKMLPEVDAMEMCDFIKPINHSQTLQLFVISGHFTKNNLCLKEPRQLRRLICIILLSTRVWSVYFFYWKLFAVLNLV